MVGGHLQDKGIVSLFNYMAGEIKLCDHCGEKPPKGIIQFEGYFEVVCPDCSKEYYKNSPEAQRIEYDGVKPGKIYGADIPEAD